MAIELHHMFVMEVTHLLYSVLVVDEVNIIGSKVVVNYSLQKIDKKNPGWVKAGMKLESRGMEQEVI